MNFQANKGQKPEVNTPKYIPEKNSKAKEEAPNVKIVFINSSRHYFFFVYPNVFLKLRIQH